VTLGSMSKVIKPTRPRADTLETIQKTSLARTPNPKIKPVDHARKSAAANGGAASSELSLKEILKTSQRVASSAKKPTNSSLSSRNQFANCKPLAA